MRPRLRRILRPRLLAPRRKFQKTTPIPPSATIMTRHLMSPRTPNTIPCRGRQSLLSWVTKLRLVVVPRRLLAREGAMPHRLELVWYHRLQEEKLLPQALARVPKVMEWMIILPPIVVPSPLTLM